MVGVGNSKGKSVAMNPNDKVRLAGKNLKYPYDELGTVIEKILGTDCYFIKWDDSMRVHHREELTVIIPSEGMDEKEATGKNDSD